MLAKIATLEEIERHWSLVDIADAHEALDIKEEAEAYYVKQAQDVRR